MTSPRVNNNNCRVLILHNCITPYRHHIFEEVSKTFPLLVVYLNEHCITKRGWDPIPRKYNYKYIILSKERNVLTVIKNLGLLLKILFNFKPKIIIIGGHSEVEMKVTAILSKILKLKLVYWTESTEIAESALPTIHRIFAKLQRIIFSRMSDSIMVPGKLSYIAERKILDKSRVFIVPNSIDEKLWLMDSHTQNENELENVVYTWQQSNSQSATKIVLFVGRMTRVKGVIPLIAASIKLLNEGENFILLMRGDGPLKEPLKEIVKKKALNNNIIFLDSISVSTLSKLYRNADVFILPSYRDVWGFVINEAALLGSKIIIGSKYSQAAYILLEGTPLLLERVNAYEIYRVLKYCISDEVNCLHYKKIVSTSYRKYMHQRLTYAGIKMLLTSLCLEGSRCDTL